jgi:redox-sensitive bicupin YhaK (pirin superfamily)
MGVSALRVINDDHIAGHQGFATHPHDNMEILTCVLSGKISHKDSMGNQGDIAAGEWQLMSAGSGILHSEINSSDVPVHLLQIWILPNVRDAEPSYQQTHLDPHDAPNQWHKIAGTTSDAAMQIRQDSEVLAAVLEQGCGLNLSKCHRLNYLHVIQGQVQIAEHQLHSGDALIFSDDVQIEAQQDAQLLWFDLP